MADSFNRRFYAGLLEMYQVSREDLTRRGYKYCGGDKGRHLNYFMLCFGDDAPTPPKREKCVCGQAIAENCYICDSEERDLIVLGNCCIKRFVAKSTRTCEDCGAPHRNRVVNRCNACRRGKCDKCGDACGAYYRTCFACGERGWRT